ncbi:outer membrane lipoprotein chaperone LolA [Methylophilus medardicus]|uniref:Outer-membrane lipoprotein carrier protein n=1 Tax=Methylophilus medardicus TaxID=2588534 RepID=A0A5B8CTN8_9PROT|nr:outer membrane lipoprotein chaperone LolA [Methylophilus medardicus]QDC44470.1 outer membrane lipoprotein chaperone LolA [Methylophilus medardicus]QDC49477.1 outer membrane lipoprotein chaperone LolA [Methylophilus medardicus]QDC53182.1 outer membrane lipoprotein chaperone LolA [Methylophilus medardicus]
MTNRWTHILIACASWCMLSAAFADGVDDLKQFYQSTHAMRANFKQTVFDQKGRKVQEVNGVMLLQRPNKFRWDYQKPYEQQIISDGRQVFLFDVDLQQVTVRTVDKVLGTSPAALLAGGPNVEETFRLSRLLDFEGMQRVQAKPKQKDSGFQVVIISFDHSKLAEMRLVDAFGQSTHIEFSSVEVNPTLNANQFLFTVPKGVDVVGE